jgi:hypothetical protein
MSPTSILVFVALPDTSGEQRRLERRGAVADGDAVLRTDVVRKVPFEHAHERTVRRHPSGVNALGQELLLATIQ